MAKPAVRHVAFNTMDRRRERKRIVPPRRKPPAGRAAARREAGPRGPGPRPRGARGPAARRRGAGAWTAVLALLAAASGSACSPIYVLKAGYHEARILAARKPIPDVIADPNTDDETRRKLRLALAARRFARDSLRLDVGASYTTFVRLTKDTLAHVLSAAHRDRLEPVTWWFPIVGRVPYRGFFSLEEALREEEKLRGRGFDTYVRPTAAFSTLGWFADPLLSTVLRYDAVGLVETVIHELTHNTLYLAGHTTFNESYAGFVGAQGAIAFFCGEPDHRDPRSCELARDRWADDVRFSTFVDALAAELEALYAREELPRQEKLRRRDEVFAAARRRFQDEVQPSLAASRFDGFLQTPLNNATLLARIRYYHRLTDFDATLSEGKGDLRGIVERIARAARALAKKDGDPFHALPRPPAPAR